MAELDEHGEHGLRNSFRPGEMHPAPSLREAPPADFPRPRLASDLQALVTDAQSPGSVSKSTGPQHQEPEHCSAPDLNRSSCLLPLLDPTATPTTRFTSTKLSSSGTVPISTTIDVSQTTLNSTSVFAVQGGPDEPEERRTPKSARRRTGPLNKEQRAKAALIRKMGACADCRRRRVSCDPARTLLSYCFLVPLDSFTPRFISQSVSPGEDCLYFEVISSLESHSTSSHLQISLGMHPRSMLYARSPWIILITLC